METTLQRHVLKYLSRIASEMMHQGVATLRLISNETDAEYALLRANGVATTSVITLQTLQALCEYIDSRQVVDPPRPPLFWLRSADRVVECRVHKGLNFTTLEVQGLLTAEAWLDELCLDLPNRMALHSLQELEGGAIVVGGATQVDKDYAAAMLATALQIPVVDEQAFATVPQAEQHVGILRIATDPLALVRPVNPTPYDGVQGMLFVSRQVRSCTLCHGRKSLTGAACSKCQGTGSFGVVPNAVVQKFSSPIFSDPPSSLVLQNGKDLLADDLAFKLEQGVLSESAGATNVTNQRASMSLAKPSQVDSSQSVKVLLVEDDADQRSILQTYLRKLGYEVYAAEDGLRGLSLLQQLTPNLIITDLMMPHMDGTEFIAQVRREPRFAGIPILVLTVVDDDEKELSALELGADDYCEKTMQRRLLIKRIERLLEKKR